MSQYDELLKRIRSYSFDNSQKPSTTTGASSQTTLDRIRNYTFPQPTVTPTITTPTVTAPVTAAVKTKSNQGTWAEAGKAIGGSGAAGVVNIVRTTLALAEKNLSTLLGNQDKSLSENIKNPFKDFKVKNALDIALATNPITSLISLARTSYKAATTDSDVNKLIKPTEEKIREWADVENESLAVRIVAGAVGSAPQMVVTALNPAIGVPLLFNQSFQGNLEQYKAAGLDLADKTVQARALGSALVETASEYMFNAWKGVKGAAKAMQGAPGVKGALNSGVKGFLDGFSREAAEKAFAPTVKNFVLHLAKQGLEEGAEEVVSGIGAGIIAKLTTEKDKALISLTNAQGGLITGEGLLEAFGSGALMGFVGSYANTQRQFSSTRKVIQEVVGEVDFRKVTPDQVQEVLDALQTDLKKPGAAESLSEALAKGTNKAAAMTADGRTVRNNQTGETLTLKVDPKSGDITMTGPSGAQTVNAEQFDALFDNQTLTEAAPAPTAASGGSLPAQAAVPGPQAGAAPTVQETTLTSGETRQEAAATYVSKSGRTAPVKAYLSGKEAVIEVTGADAPVPYFIRFSPDEYAQAANKGRFLQMASAAKKGQSSLAGWARQNINPSNYQGFYSTLTQLADTAVRNVAVRQQVEATQTMEDEAVKATKGKANLDLTEADTTRVRKAREAARKMQEGQLDAKTLAGLKKVDADLEKMGIDAYYTPTAQANLTKQHKAVQKILEDATGKKIVFIHAIGPDVANEFVTDFSGDTVFVNTNNEKVKITWSVGHGLYHLMVKEGVHKALEAAMLESMGKTRQQLIDEKMEAYAGLPGYKLDADKAIEEALADRAGEIFASEEFWQKLVEKIDKPSLARRILDKIAEWLGKFQGTTQEIDAMLKAIEKAQTIEKGETISYTETKGVTQNGREETESVRTDSESRSTAGSAGSGDQAASVGEGIQRRINPSPDRSVQVELTQTTSAKDFSDAIQRAVESNKHGSFVEAKPESEYARPGTKLFLSSTKESGFAITPEGDLVSLFKVAGSKDKNVLHYALLLSVQHGSKTLDCFDGYLPENYAQYGYIPVARLKWNDEYAPPRWNYERDGRPDVVFMAHNGDSYEQVLEKQRRYPVYDPANAPYVNDYDAGKKAQQDYFNTNSSVKYSINPNFTNEYDAWDRKDPRAMLNVGRTPKPLLEIGVRNQDIAWKTSDFLHIRLKHPAMTNALLKQVPDIIERPIVVVTSSRTEGNNRIVLFGDLFSANNNPIVTVLELEPESFSGKHLDRIEIATAYDRAYDPQGLINNGKLLYVDSDIKRTANWLRRSRLNLPFGPSHYGSIDRVTYKKPLVNKADDTKYSLRQDAASKAHIAQIMAAAKKAGRPVDKQTAREVYDIMQFADSQGETLSIGEAAAVYEIYNDPGTLMDEELTPAERLARVIDVMHNETDFGEIDEQDISYSLEEHRFNRAFTENYLSKPTLERITDAHRKYRRLPNEETLQKAAKMIDENYKAAWAAAHSVENLSAVHTAMRLYFLYNADLTNNPAEAADWAWVLNKAGMAAGQAVQAYVLLDQLSPVAKVYYAEKELQGTLSAEQRQLVEDKSEKMKAEIDKIDLEAATQVLSRIEELLAKTKRSADQAKRRLEAAERLEERIRDTIGVLEEFDADAVREFIDNLHGLAAATTPIVNLPKTSNPISFMRWVMRNIDSMGGLFSDAYKMAKRMHGTDQVFMAEIEAYLGDFIPELAGQTPADLTPKMAETIRAAMTANAKDYLTYQAMVKRLIELGVDPRDSVLVAREAQRQIRKLTGRQKVMALRKILPKAGTKGMAEMVMRIVNISNERGLTDAEVRGYAAKLMGLPGLTTDLADTILTLSKGIADINENATREGRKLTEEEQRDTDILMAQMLSAVQREKPVKLSQKIDLLQSMIMMSMFKSGLRNIIGNAMFAGADLGTDVIAASIDKVLSKFTGNRVIPLPQLAAAVRGAVKSARYSAYDIAHDIDTGIMDTQYNLPRGEVFKSKLGKLAMRVFRYKMQLPDRFFQGAAYQSHLEGLMKLKGETEPSQETKEAAEYYAQYKTFADDNVASKSLSLLRDFLNNFHRPAYWKSSKQDKAQWGFGSWIVKFPKVPGALLMRTIENSPVSLVKALFYLAKPMYEAQRTGTRFKENFEQQKFALSLARGTWGSMISIGVGLLLTGLGLMTGAPPKDDKEKRMLETMGIARGYQMNWSGLWRFLISGLDPEAAVMQEGDRISTYSWAAPMALGMAIGANIVQDARDVRESDLPAAEEAVNVAISAFSAGLDSITEMSVMSGVFRLMENFRYADSTGEALLKSAVNVPASFIPQQLKIMRDLIDNTQRTTYDNSLLTYSFNLIKNRLPGASQTLAPAVDALGNLKEVYQKNGNNVWNVFFNPAYSTRYMPNDAAILVLATMAEKQGTRFEDDNVTPTMLKGYLTYTDAAGMRQKITLTPQEKAELQRQVGSKVEELFAKIPANLTLDAKVKAMTGILNDVAYAYKQQLLAKKLLLRK